MRETPHALIAATEACERERQAARGAVRAGGRGDRFEFGLCPASHEQYRFACLFVQKLERERVSLGFFDFLQDPIRETMEQRF